MKIDDFDEQNKLILSSIVNERCTVAISTDSEVQLVDIQERNKKKLAKLHENLHLLMEKTTAEKYIKKTKPRIKERDSSQVRQFNQKKKQHFILLLHWLQN